MPTTDRCTAPYPCDYLAPKKYALVVSCVDARLLDDTVRFLNHDNLTNRYYHVAVPGAALCVCGATLDSDNTSQPPVTVDAWWRALADQLLLTLKLTKFELTDVYILQHRDCGAYKVYLKDLYGDGSPAELKEERKVHKHHAELLRERIKKEAYQKDGPVQKLAEYMCIGVEEVKLPKVHGFLMDLRGGVERLFG